MRPDMAKILCERPRAGGGKLKGRANNTPIEELPTKESMTKKWLNYGVNKELNENLRPLERFLNSCVGRKWNDVYSEIRERINPKSAIQLHILQHLEHMVELETFEQDGKIYCKSVIGPRELFGGELYVQEGILKRYPKTRYKKDKTDIKIKNKWYRKINGEWYFSYYEEETRTLDKRKYTVKIEKSRKLNAKELKWLTGYLTKMDK